MARSSKNRAIPSLIRLPILPESLPGLLRVLVEDRGDLLWPVVRQDPALAVHLLRWLGQRKEEPLPARPESALEQLRGESLAEWVADACAASGSVVPTTESAHCAYRRLCRFCLVMARAAAELWPSVTDGDRPRRRRATSPARSTPPVLFDQAPWRSLLAMSSAAGLFMRLHVEPRYPELIARTRSLKHLRSQERQTLGMDHVQFMATLARQWKFPSPFIDILEASIKPAGKHGTLARFLMRQAEQAWKATDDEAVTAPQPPPEANSLLDNGRSNDEKAGAETTPLLTTEMTEKLARQLAERHRLVHRFHDEKLASLAEFAAGAAHELNNPLAVIYGRAQLLLMGEDDSERRRALLGVATQANRIHEMIADLMLFARPPKSRRETIDLCPVAEDAVRHWQPLANEQGTGLRMAKTQPATVSADPVQMRVLVNALIQNALQALKAGGHVTVTLEKTPAPEPTRSGATDPVVCLRVSDSGPGLSPDDRRHLFDPLYCGRTAGRGLGLGLAKCWRIVQNHGGRIEAINPPQGGTTLVVHLPMQTTSPLASRSAS